MTFREKLNTYTTGVQAQKIKAHLEANKKTYIVSAATMTIGYLIGRSRTNSVIINLSAPAVPIEMPVQIPVEVYTANPA